MNNIFLILLVGLLFIVLFGGLSLLRREGLSNRFAAESVVVTLIFAGLAYLFPDRINPILFFDYSIPGDNACPDPGRCGNFLCQAR